MLRAGLVLGLVAAPLAVTDLAHKAVSEAAVYHARPALQMALLAVAATAWAAAVAATRSTMIAAPAGILLGGVAGNLASIVLWPGVPDPLVAGPIAYNLADAFIVAGLVLTLAGATAFAVRNRERLGELVELR